MNLYLECYSGISGDMMVAALLDLGADQDVLEKALQSLPIHGFKTQISRVSKSGLDACDFNVILDSKYENHDHDMKYLHEEACHKQSENSHMQVTEHQHEHEHEHKHEHEHEHQHEYEHTHEYENQNEHEHEHEHTHEHDHTHEHRGLTEILDIIDRTDISNRAKMLAIRIFNILANAEAKAHGVEIDQVHFHEVGAVDSIVDIVSVAVCLDNLGIEEVIVPVLYEGTGFVKCQHGIIPVPVPAVSNIVSDNGLKLHITKSEGEFVTPTGAAIVAAIRTSDQLPEQFSIKKIGIGAGKRNYERPSILRAMMIQEDYRETDYIYKLESNIDDCTGENLGYVMERLFEAGARDVNYIPVYMKKNRPAYQLNVICKKEDMNKIEQIIFEETTTIGIRRQQMERSILKRELQKKQTSLGEVQVKICNLTSGRRCYPEYSSVVEMCKKHKMSYQDVYQIILNECNNE